MSNQEDPRNYKVSFDKIRNRIGFSCRKKLEDGIIEIKQSIDNGLITDYKDPKYSNYQLLKELDLEQDSFLFKIGIS